MERFKAYIFSSPGWKTFFSVVFPIAIGVISGAYVNEITTSDGVKWARSWSSTSFYLLIAAAIIMVIFHRAVYLHETSVDKFRDDQFCMAYVRSKCLPEAAERYRELIRSGDGGQLKQAMDELKKALK
jgi:hypothetical protein